MGNGGLGSFIKHSATMGRLGLGLLDLEGEVFSLSALLACNCVEDLFLGLGRQQGRAEMARQMFARLDCRDDGHDSLVDSACSQRQRE